MSDRITGAFFLALSIWYGIAAQGFEQGFGDPVGPSAFPTLLAFPMGGFALWLIVRPDPEPTWPRGAALARQLGMLVAIIAYPLLLLPLGFPLATALGLFATSMLLNARPVNALIAAVVLSVGLFLLFDRVLGLPLPMLPESMR